ncbi:hypothetical protein M441DRAFT_385661 [Trichoderma asperellum CBS 433.97]|uniref:Uncharacterized protein n=1 Tax=Trichoderma asperellum (strain ATCC 204424 / CBS 433.97 / NBRC 101777) TaxID=1042311 RepID=A0A2T3ZBK6_TRIA4|nr:hypothetical protein M441DRAFT_385661 [Trichoderma asperellum CBS 433.97]PTB42187.1 hypothetical protein M441DRAFT_385661 [Trichoderma asperellum CBS 433.97]
MTDTLITKTARPAARTFREHNRGNKKRIKRRRTACALRQVASSDERASLRFPVIPATSHGVLSTARRGLITPYSRKDGKWTNGEAQPCRKQIDNLALACTDLHWFLSRSMDAFLLISRGLGALCTAFFRILWSTSRRPGLDVIREAVQPSLKVCAVAIPRSKSSIADKLASSIFFFFFPAGSRTVGKLSVESRAGQRTRRCLGADAPLRGVTSAHDFLPIIQ